MKNFILGVGVGMVLAVFTALNFPSEERELSIKAQTVIEACEMELPRIQHCVLSAIPEEGLYGDDY